MFHGTGINHVFADGEQPCEGFWAGRVVKSTCAEEAVELAKRLINDEWLRDGHALAAHGAMPRLEIDAVEEIGWWRARRSRNRGFTFYHDTNEK